VAIFRTISRQALFALALMSTAEFTQAQVVPGDAKPLCVFGATELRDWFATGSVTANGVVKRADSLRFTEGTEGDCAYYKWATRMFLWLTSPAPGGGTTTDTSEFYSISALVDGKRTLAQNGGGNSLLSLRAGKAVEEDGQPGPRSVLMARNGSLVYYSSQMNDIFAHFLTTIKKGLLPSGPDLQLPTEQAELDAVASAAGVNFQPNMLVLQTKSAWIETTGLDRSKYITTMAKVPSFDKSLGWRWTPDGNQPDTELALVGMHVVGTVKGRPDMVWATFEHVDNVPMATYSYIDVGDNFVNVNPQPGTWQFSGSNCAGTFNQERMHARNRPHIEAVDQTSGMGPSDTCRINAWGSLAGSTSSYREDNTRIIAVNNGAFGKLRNGDLRKNYMLIGATWNAGLGTNHLANTTLETYVQGTNCFSCHNGRLTTGMLSHMWLPVLPLP